MCWTPLYTRHKTKTNKTKNTTQYVLDTTIHKTQDEDKQNTTQYVLDTTMHKTQDGDKQNTTQYVLDTPCTRHKTKTNKTQHNMCWTPL